MLYEQILLFAWKILENEKLIRSNRLIIFIALKIDQGQNFISKESITKRISIKPFQY